MSPVLSPVLSSQGEESKRDSSTAQADAFPGANAEEKESACSARNDRSELGRLRYKSGPPQKAGPTKAGPTRRALTALANYVGHDVHHNVGLTIEDHDARADYAALVVRRQRRQLPSDFNRARLQFFLESRWQSSVALELL